MRILVLLIAGILAGCATTTLTEEEYVACKGDEHCLTAALAIKVEDEQWAAEDRRILKEEEMVSYIIGCHYAGDTMFYRKWGGGIGSNNLIDRHGVVHLPKHATIQDFSCVRAGDASLILERMGIGGNHRRMGERR